MKQTESFELKGYWWLPLKPSIKIAGIVTYTPGEGIILELFGSFKEENDVIELLSADSSEETIHGMLENAQDVTLLHCSPSVNYNLSSFPVIKYSCTYCFIGEHFNSLNDKGRFSIKAQFPELSYWCRPAVIQETIAKNKENKGQTISISINSENGGKILDEVKLEDDFNIRLRAGANFRTTAGLLDNYMNQSTWVEISREDAVSFNELLTQAHKFEGFLSLATLRVVESSEIVLYDEDYYQEDGAGTKHYFAIHFFSSHWRGRGNGKVEFFRFLFGYDAIKNKFAQIMQAWYADKNDMSPIRESLIDSFEKKRIFSSMDFLILARALDGYCIRSKYKGSLTNRMKAVIEKFSDITRIKRDNINVEELVDSRDYYAHFMPRSRKKNVLDGSNLHTLTQKVRRLVICCILYDLGFDKSAIDAMLSKCNSWYIKS